MLKLNRNVALGLCLASVLASHTVSASGTAVRNRTSRLIVHMTDAASQRVRAASANQPVAGLRLPGGSELTFRRRFSDDAMVVELPEAVSLEEAERLSREIVAGEKDVLPIQG